MFHVQETFVNNLHMVATGTAGFPAPTVNPQIIQISSKNSGVAESWVPPTSMKIPKKWFDDAFGAENLHQNLTLIVLVRAPVNNFEKVPIDS